MQTFLLPCAHLALDSWTLVCACRSPVARRARAACPRAWVHRSPCLQVDPHSRAREEGLQNGEILTPDFALGVWALTSAMNVSLR